MKSLGIFIHYGNEIELPHYVTIYANELSSHFDEIALLYNKRELVLGSVLLNHNIKLVPLENKGYDLGMFYNYFKTINPADFFQIACINDSNVLFNRLKQIFDWSKTKDYDFWGLIDSHEKPWFSTNSENYHIQSHFVVFNQRAIEKLPLFFESLDMSAFFNQKNLKLLRQSVINNWEIGLTQFMLNLGLSCGSYINSEVLSKTYLFGKPMNVSHELYDKLIESGYPLIKKKVVIKDDWTLRKQDKKCWKSMLHEYGKVDWNIEHLIHELNQIRNRTEAGTFNRFKRKLTNSYQSLLNSKIL